MKRLICKIFGHKYFLIRRITPVIREVGCKRCGQEFGMHDEVQAILPLDDELRYANNILRSVKNPDNL